MSLPDRKELEKKIFIEDGKLVGRIEDKIAEKIESLYDPDMQFPIIVDLDKMPLERIQKHLVRTGEHYGWRLVFEKRAEGGCAVQVFPLEEEKK